MDTARIRKRLTEESGYGHGDAEQLLLNACGEIDRLRTEQRDFAIALDKAGYVVNGILSTGGGDSKRLATLYREIRRLVDVVVGRATIKTQHQIHKGR
jgi:hypothetical protein